MAPRIRLAPAGTQRYSVSYSVVLRIDLLLCSVTSSQKNWPVRVERLGPVEHDEEVLYRFLVFCRCPSLYLSKISRAMPRAVAIFRAASVACDGHRQAAPDCCEALFRYVYSQYAGS